jgi:hypothetical protein
MLGALRKQWRPKPGACDSRSDHVTTAWGRILRLYHGPANSRNRRIMPFHDPSLPGHGAETTRAASRLVDHPRLLDEAACALRGFLFRMELFSLNSTNPSHFDRLKSRMSLERCLSRFSYEIFDPPHLSQKPSFSRGLVR